MDAENDLKEKVINDIIDLLIEYLYLIENVEEFISLEESAEDGKNLALIQETAHLYLVVAEKMAKRASALPDNKITIWMKQCRDAIIFSLNNIQKAKNKTELSVSQMTSSAQSRHVLETIKSHAKRHNK